MRYIVPEMEIRVFAHEDIVTGSAASGDSVQAVKDSVNSASASYGANDAVVADWNTMQMGN